MTQKSARLKIIVGIPAYNEAKYIAGVILQSRQYADAVVVVNDGSKDNTAKISKLAGAQVVEHGNNRGYGSAIRSIIATAIKDNADILVILDGDSQHDPDDIPALIKAVNEGSDVVIGSRVSDKNAIPAYRRFGQNVLAKFTNIASRQKVKDTESGFRAYSKKAIETLELKETGMAVSAEIIAEASRRGLKITEVPISVTYTKDGSTLNPVMHGLGNLNRITIMISESRPLFFFGLAGVTLLVAGAVTGVVAIQIYSSSKILVMGWALITMLLVTVGMLCLFTGLILNTLIRRIGK